MAIARVSRVVLSSRRIRSGPTGDNGLALQVPYHTIDMVVIHFPLSWI